MSRSTIVNAITFARVPLIVAWAVLAIIEEFRGGIAFAALACAMMLLSALTDLWDGKLAHKWNCVSRLGKMADPLMDKVFYLVAFPELVWQIMHQAESEEHALAMLVFTILYLFRDTWVTFMRSIGTMYGADVAAKYLGKVRTALSFPGAGWVYAFLAFHRFVPAAWAEVWLTSCYFVEMVLAGLTVVSFFTYTKDYWPYLKKALAQK